MNSQPIKDPQWTEVLDASHKAFKVPGNRQEMKRWIQSNVHEFGRQEYACLVDRALDEISFIEYWGQMVALPRPTPCGHLEVPAWWLANVCCQKAAQLAKPLGLESMASLAAWFSQLGWFWCHYQTQRQPDCASGKVSAITYKLVRDIRSRKVKALLLTTNFVQECPLEAVALCRLLGVQDEQIWQRISEPANESMRSATAQIIEKSSGELRLMGMAMSIAQAQVLSSWRSL